MKIAFVSHYCAFHYRGIGGTESFARRLAHGLAQNDDQVSFLVYGWMGSPPPQPSLPGIRLYYFDKFVELLDFIQTMDFDHIITVYIRRKDRLRYALFRHAFRKKTKFHIVHLGWHPKGWGRILRLFELRLAPYNGFIFTVSPRLYREALRCTNRVVHLWPPVPDHYFVSPEAKAPNTTLNVSFIGRLDSGKGIYEALDIFAFFRERFGATCHVYGLYSEGLPESRILHQRLQTMPEVIYIPVEREAYSENVEERIRQRLLQTDLLVLPYRVLHSSIDTPLLILEGMASLCAIVTPAHNHIRELYGNSPFLVDQNLNDWKQGFQDQNIEKILQMERQRLWFRNQQLDFHSSSIVRLFRQVLKDG